MNSRPESDPKLHVLLFYQGIMTSSASHASDGGDEVVRSPLSQAPAPVDAPEGASKLPLMGVKKETQAVLTYIKQVNRNPSPLLSLST